MTTIPLNLLYSFLCGGCLAACAGSQMSGAVTATGRPRHRQPGPAAAPLGHWMRLLQAPLLFAALAVVPAAVYLAAQFPDWSVMYLIDPQRSLGALPLLWPVGAGLLTGAAVVPGFILGLRGHRRHGVRLLGLALFGLLALYLLCALWGLRAGRLSLVGTYADFHAGRWLMRPLFSLPAWRLGDRAFALFYDLIAVNLCQGISLALVARALLTKSEFIVDRPISYWQS